MTRTASTMLALGTAAPDFSLPDVVSGRTISLASYAGSPALLVIFMRVAYVSLPLGIGPFRTVSLALLRLIGA